MEGGRYFYSTYKQMGENTDVDIINQIKEWDKSSNKNKDSKAPTPYQFRANDQQNRLYAREAVSNYK